jgi:cytochrome c5
MQRLAPGRDAMLATVLRGKGAIARMGGNASLLDAQTKAAADHLLSQAR